MKGFFSSYMCKYYKIYVFFYYFKIVDFDR